jgi:hypothetical protein
MSAAIISIYGSNLPDMRGVFPRGWDHGRGLDPNAPSLLTYVADEFASHAHTVTDPHHAHASAQGNFLTTTGSSLAYATGGGTTTGQSALTAAASTGISINANGGAETAPKYMPWMFIIKT